MNNQMTTEQAIEMVDQVCAKFLGSRQDHLNLQLAIRTLRDATKEATPSEVPETDENKKG